MQAELISKSLLKKQIIFFLYPKQLVHSSQKIATAPYKTLRQQLHAADFKQLNKSLRQYSTKHFLF
jgi:hypothetical protein